MGACVIGAVIATAPVYAEMAPEAIEIPTKAELNQNKTQTKPNKTHKTQNKAKVAPKVTTSEDKKSPDETPVDTQKEKKEEVNKQEVSEKAPQENNAEPALKSGSMIYVSEDSGIWTTKGPGREYKLATTVHPGDPLELISEKKEYYQVKTQQGKVVWIPQKYTQREESSRSKVASLQKENDELKYKLEHIDSENAKELRIKTKELIELREAHDALEKEQASQVQELKEARAIKADLDAQLKTKEQEMQIRWWKNGALIAGVGALVGVILVYLPRPRRKRNNDFY